MSYAPTPDGCDHTDRTYIGTDTEDCPESVYEDWRCDSCGAAISDVYDHAGYRIVITDGDITEEPIDAWGNTPNDAHYEGSCDHCGEVTGQLRKVRNADAYLCGDCRRFDQ